MEADLCRQRKDKNEKWANFRVNPDEYSQFAASCAVLGKTKAQVFRQMMRMTNAEARLYAAQLAAAEPPEFAMLTIEEAREFLKPYFNGKPPSAATLERRIADGLLVAAQDHPSRTAPLRIYKASLVRWMRRLGKKFDADFDD